MRLTLEQRTAALLALVDEYRARRCAELLDPAHEQARAILRRARTEGRRRVRTTIAEARQRLAAEVGAAQARLSTERRLAEQRRAFHVLRDAWLALRQTLLARWRDPTLRRLWLDEHLARALRVLPPAQWQIEFAVDLPAADREALAERIAAAGVPAASWRASDTIDGGLRIRAGNNLVDATIDGLLADRGALEGRLLDLLQEAAPASEAPPPRGILATEGEAE